MRVSMTLNGVLKMTYLYGLALVHFNDVEVKTVDSFSWGQKHRLKCEEVSNIYENLQKKTENRSSQSSFPLFLKDRTVPDDFRKSSQT